MFNSIFVLVFKIQAASFFKSWFLPFSYGFFFFQMPPDDLLGRNDLLAKHY